MENTVIFVTNKRMGDILEAQLQAEKVIPI